MTPFDRAVRAEVYRLLTDGVDTVDAATLADARGWDRIDVGASLERLRSEHRLALVDGTDRVEMAHPFAGVPTGYRAEAGHRSWFANCAWDALAIVAMLGDGFGRAFGRDGGVDWTIENGRVAPDGLVHLLVPASDFWDDIGFT